MQLTRVVDSFPSVTIDSYSGGLPVEVSLIVQLGHGAGNHLFNAVLAKQQQHLDYIDELDEPSAKLAGVNSQQGDMSSLYSFTLGPKGHPFHRHKGQRIFTAISGSGGTQLRFSTASTKQMRENPQHFIHALRFVNIPADCLFTVRFGGETWHQFMPLAKNSLHPTLFALSCHPNELGGELDDETLQEVMSNQASIPSLTELLPEDVLSLLSPEQLVKQDIPTTVLSLDAAEGTLLRHLCDRFRHHAGLVRGAWSARIHSPGFQSFTSSRKYHVERSHLIADDSLLQKQLTDRTLHHEDAFALKLDDIPSTQHTATEWLSALLEGFLSNSPPSVARLMSFRNIVVSPFKLRTSPLGCPVSSLLGEKNTHLFDNRYPVIDQFVNEDNTHAQVILGADDKHLSFRSYVSVRLINQKNAEFRLENRVACHNLFGRLYMASIDLTHRYYIGPTMLRWAVSYALMQMKWTQKKRKEAPKCPA